MSAPKTHPLLGSTAPDLIGELIGAKTTYLAFDTRKGVSGLAREDGAALEILTVESHPPGKGHFRRFIRVAMKTYREVRILWVHNDSLKAALVRYGFSPTAFPIDGELVDAYVYLQPNATKT